MTRWGTNPYAGDISCGKYMEREREGKEIELAQRRRSILGSTYNPRCERIYRASKMGRRCEMERWERGDGMRVGCDYGK